VFVNKHFLIGSGLLLTLVACPQAAPTNVVTTVSLAPASSVILLGATQQLSAQALNASGGVVSGAGINFSSSTPNIVTIDANGLATGVAIGQSDITATIQNTNVSATSKLTVQTTSLATWSTIVTEYRGQNGLRLTHTCPANPDQGFNTVWGTDTYTDDSAICAAAVHAGKITTAGGNILLEIRAGQDSYEGTTRNGVTSSPYGNWGGSYVFVNP
jgi:hypothetical protein